MPEVSNATEAAPAFREEREESMPAGLVLWMIILSVLPYCAATGGRTESRSADTAERILRSRGMVLNFPQKYSAG